VDEKQQSTHPTSTLTPRNAQKSPESVHKSIYLVRRINLAEKALEELRGRGNSLNARALSVNSQQEQVAPAPCGGELNHAKQLLCWLFFQIAAQRTSLSDDAGWPSGSLRTPALSSPRSLPGYSIANLTPWWNFFWHFCY